MGPVTSQSPGKAVEIPAGRPRAAHGNSAAAQTHNLLYFKALLTSIKPTTLSLPRFQILLFGLFLYIRSNMTKQL